MSILRKHENIGYWRISECDIYYKQASVKPVTVESGFGVLKYLFGIVITDVETRPAFGVVLPNGGFDRDGQAPWQGISGLIMPASWDVHRARD
ncbi:MAG TPA: hypothetical protein VHD56_00625 [Tepidisphaeraceae bacterium]|nr:hypothetical protein [Tepidisphaeraceae bacterium]